MRSGSKLGAILVLLSFALPAHAQKATRPQLFDFSVLLGYRTNVSFSGPADADVVLPRVIIDPSPSYGVAFGARLSEEDLIELRWARMDSTMRVEQNFLTLYQQKVTVDQFHADFTHEYILDNWPAQVRPYIMASVGATHIAGAETRNFTRFSLGIGAGFKVFLNRNVGFRLQGEWVPILIDPEVGIACGAGCIVHLKTQFTSQGEFAAGPLFRF